MSKLLNEYIANSTDRYPDSVYGDGVRCSVDLQDGTHLPCVLLRRPKARVDLAIKRFAEEKKGRGVLRRYQDPYREIVKNFVIKENSVSNYDVMTVKPSPFALPLDLLRQIHGETFMSWTGWVFEMDDGAKFSYGSTFLYEFFDLPEGYNFDNVTKVHSGYYISLNGEMMSINADKEEYLSNRMHERPNTYREKPYFICYVDE